MSKYYILAHIFSSVYSFEVVSGFIWTKGTQPEVQRQYNQLPTPWLTVVHPTVCFHHHHTFHLPTWALEKILNFIIHNAQIFQLNHTIANGQQIQI